MAIGTVHSTNAARLYSVNNVGRKTDVKKSAFSPREEKVEISTETAEKADRMKLAKVIASTPDIRIELVEELKAKIRSNDYPIESKLDETVRRIMRDEGFSSRA